MRQVLICDRQGAETVVRGGNRAQVPEDTTPGWCFVNPAMRVAYGVDPTPETAEIRRGGMAEWRVSRAEQDAIALASQRKTAAAQSNGRLAAEIVPVSVPQRKGKPILLADDDHPRATDPAARDRSGGNARRIGGCGDPPWSSCVSACGRASRC